MDYIGTIFVAVIAFWLGYALGKLKKQEDAYDLGYSRGHFDARYEEQKQKEGQTRLPVPPDKWETPLG